MNHHHQVIQLLPVNTDQIPTVAPVAILFHPEAAWRDQEVIRQDLHPMAVPLHQEAADHLTAAALNQGAHTLQDHHHQVHLQAEVLHQAAAVADHPQEGDRL